MRIDGEWFECDDGIVRPVVRGETLRADGGWEPTPFLIDTGADCTVFSAAILDMLGYATGESVERLGGIGGVAPSVQLTTQVRLPRDGGGQAIFRGQFSAFTQLESLDMCVLGRDILRFFAVIVDIEGDVVTVKRNPHRYIIESA